MADQVLNVTIKGIGDFSDVVSNVDNVQKALSKLKIPDKLKDSLSKNIGNFTREYDKYQQKLSEGIKTPGDKSAVDKSLNSMLSSYQKIINDFNKIQPKDFKELFKLDEGAFASVQNKIRDIQSELDKVKLDPSKINGPLEQIANLTKSDKIIGPNGAIKLFEKGMAEGDFEGLEKAKTAFAELESYYERMKSKMAAGGTTQTGWEGALNQLRSEMERAEGSAGPLVTKMAELRQELSGVGAKGMSEFNGMQQGLEGTRQGAERVTDALKNMHNNEFNFNRQAQNIDRQIQSYFGLAQMIRKVGNIAKDAFKTVKELDQAMTATAVVTNFSVGDMWEMLPTYTEQANKLGSTIKDVYESTTLYYQQGLNKEQAMGLSEETLKMARIAGMDAAEATDMMTSALRGFNMEINQTSAQKVNDIYSQLAAVSASDTREIGTAMEKTASLASSANMKIETTSAFLAQMIETTREAPENLGTAMKTIIARFQEMKKDPSKLIDSEGVAMDVNKVDAALKSVGIQLTNTKGEFRALDEVYLEIASKWDSLTQGQQRYIATTAAGSRQQSRFIAMMSNYDRTMELVNQANDSAGASQKQYEKTMESMSFKLNKLKNAWDQFAMGLMNNKALKTGVDFLTKFLGIINKVIDGISKATGPLKGVTKSLLTIGATFTGLNFAKSLARGSVMAGAGWWKNEGTIRENFRKGYGSGEKREILGPEQMQQQRMAGIYQKFNSSTPLPPIQAQMPIDATAYLEKLNNADLTDEARAEIMAEIGDGVNVPVKTRMFINNGMLGAGNEEFFLPIDKDKNGNPLPDPKPQMDSGGKSVSALSQGFNTLGTSISQAGFLLQRFGASLGPLGGVISTVGTALMSLGTTISTMIPAFQAARAAGQGFFSSLITAIGPMTAIIAAAAAVAIAIKLIDDAIETDEERLERFSNAASNAAEEYNSLKQESSELNDSLEQIQSNEDAFKNLVAGTTEFNEKLIEANQTISELVDKYPQLNEYLTTDDNGLLHIEEEGLDILKKDQAQKTASAAALASIANGQFETEKNTQKVEDKADDLYEKSKEFLIKKAGEDIEKQLREQGETDEIAINRAVGEAEQRESEKYPAGAYTKEQRKATIEKAVKQNKELKKLKKDLDRVDNEKDIKELGNTEQGLASSLIDIDSSQRQNAAKRAMNNYTRTKNFAEKQANKASEDDMKKEYAAQYGYDYVDGKVLGKDGKEKTFEEEGGLKTAYTNMVMLNDLQKNVKDYENIKGDLNNKLLKGLDIESSNNTDNLISDILEKNIETDPDALRKIIQNPEEVKEVLTSYSDKQKAILLNTTEDRVKKDRDSYNKELTDLFNNNAESIIETEKSTYSDFGAKLAQSKGSKNEEALVKEVEKIGFERASLLNNIGESLQDNAGMDTMQAFIKNASDVYINKSKEAKNELDSIIKGVNWESPTSRLEAYNKMLDSSRESIRKIGEESRNSAGESNLLGEAFSEFIEGDWIDLQENADEFKNSLGEFDSAGILKAAEQSRTLKTMLDSDEVSASGLAMALQAIDDGKLVSASETALKLLSSLNRVTDAALEAHNTIQNFDPGIDYGESEDFMMENAKKVQEFMDNNEWGNEQLQNYIKLAAGEERYNEVLRENNGNLQETNEQLKHYVTDFSEGTGKVWDSFVNKQGMNNKSFEENLSKIEDTDLKKKFENVDLSWGDNDLLNIEFGDLTTEEFEKYLQEVGGLSEEYSKLMLENLANYDGTIRQTLAANDLLATVGKDSEFADTHQRADKKGLALAGSDIIAYQEAGGDLQKLAKAAGYKTVSELWENDFKTTKNRQERTDYDKLLSDFGKTFYKEKGKNNIESIFAQASFKDSYGNFDIAKLISDSSLKGMSDVQSIETAYEAYKKLTEGQRDDAYINGVHLDKNLTKEQFKEKAEEESSKASDEWVKVGQTIGEQIVNALNASSFLEEVRNGKGDAFSDNKLDKDKFGFAMEQIKNSGESKEKTKEDITSYLKNSKDEFDKMNTEQQTEALKGVVDGLNNFKFNSQEIASIINNGLGTNIHGGKGEGSGLEGKAGNVELNADNLKQSAEGALQDLTANVKDVKAEEGATIAVKGQLTGIVASGGMLTMATGQNNPNSVFHRTGTMARGSRGGYTISGRPTLTGEEGEELVWEPKQNQAYMVGSNGPQFANISKDAVVWNADQTKRIKKNSGSVGRVGTGARGITPIGTMAEGTGGGGLKIPGTGTMDVIGNVTELIPSAQIEEIPVKVKPEFGGEDGKLFGGGDQAPAIKAAVEASTINVADSAKKISGMEGSISKVEKSGTVSGEPIKLSAVVNSVTPKTTQPKQQQPKQEQPKNTTSTHTVQTKATNTAQNMINNIKAKLIKVPTTIDNGAKKALNALKSAAPHIKVPIRADFQGSWSKTVTINKSGGGGAKGINNYISHAGAPRIGSAAKGRGGRLGPDGKGGPTLTGEKGFEIAWIPSESRSMILGAQGPQMIDLPSDAVVWNNSQSKKILKQKAIPAGSQKKGYAGIKRPGSSSSGGGSTKTKKKKTSTSRSSGGDSKKNKTNNSTNKNVSNAAAAVARVSVWWENIARKTQTTQRRMDKNSKDFEKYIKDIRATLRKTGASDGGKGDAYIKSLKDYININQTQINRANKELKALDTGKGAKTNKKRKKQYSKGAVNIAEISYEKKKKTKKEYVNLAGFIRQDKDGSYQISEAALKKVKNKNKRKAIAEAAEKEINDRISKRNSAEDAIEKAREALEKMGQELYETFFKWETELTKIWNITQKIEEAQSRVASNDSYKNLLEAQLGSGLLTAGTESKDKTLTNFKKRLEAQKTTLEERNNAIKQNQEDLLKAISSSDENQILTSVKNKLKQNTAYDKQAKKVQDAASAQNLINQKKSRNKTISSRISTLQKNIKRLNKKDSKSKAEKEKLKKYKAELKSLQTEKKNNDKIISTKTKIAKSYNTLKDQLKQMSGNLSETERSGYEEYKKELEKQISVINTANKFTKFNRQADGTFSIDFYTEAFEQERLNGNITSDMAKAIDEYVKKVQESTKTLSDNYKSLIEDATEFYSTLETLREEWADYGDQLTQISEEAESKKIEEVKQISNSVKDGLDKLFNEVKRNLDERRKQEDNRKTELDISQKQQRLASLRADTSGGNQVEIAQLEKEIEEAQRDYERSLEDQLLDKLQEQADLAAEQRERQIEIEEAIASSVNNIALVNKWMANPEDYEDDIREAYYISEDYYNKSTASQQKISDDFEKFYNGLITNQEEQQDVKEKINGIQETLDSIDEYIRSLGVNLSTAQENGLSAKEAKEAFSASYSDLKQIGGYEAKDFIKSGWGASELKQGGFTAAEAASAGIDSNEKLKEGGYTAKDLKDSGLATTLPELMKLNYNLADLKKLFDAKEFGAAKIDYQSARKAGWTANELKNVDYYKSQANSELQKSQKAPATKTVSDKEKKLIAYRNKIAAAAKNKKIGAKELKEVQTIANNAGLHARTYLQDLANTSGLTWKQIISAAKSAGYNKNKMAATFSTDGFKKAFDAVYGSGEYKKAKNKKAAKYAYKTGGLANYTGPAWLDGTPSKPELVLNAKDTKNFLILRDILSSAIGATGTEDNSYVTNEFNININVDKVANDYDVDKIVTKVKKEITKSAGYRNVTQVRNLR